MNYLIDGHNLIPHIPDLSLEAIDDEKDLIHLLQEFCRVRPRTHIHVYFDNAPAGAPPERRYGPVTAHFVPSRTTADNAIAVHIQRLGRAARNWTVVSSDRQVQAAARAQGASVKTSSAFSAELKRALRTHATKKDKRDLPLSTEEVDEWLQIFRGKRK